VSAVLDIIYEKPEKIEENHRQAYILNNDFFQLALDIEKKNFSKITNKSLAEMHMDFSIRQEKAHIHSVLTTWYVDSTGGLFTERLLKETEEIIKNRNLKLNPAEVFTILTTPEKNSLGLEEVMNTSPDFVPIIKKAGAIVAEEGGITGHVSVVSREFGIPAVVGIDHITKIIKDGDLVEVDAERGVVTILEKSNYVVKK
jgi:hypothetical protein